MFRLRTAKLWSSKFMSNEPLYLRDCYKRNVLIIVLKVSDPSYMTCKFYLRDTSDCTTSSHVHVVDQDFEVSFA
jgi:hypothetical protein